MLGRLGALPVTAAILVLALQAGCDPGAHRERPVAAARDASTVGAPAPVPAPAPAPDVPAVPSASAPAAKPQNSASGAGGTQICSVAFIGDSLTDPRVGGGGYLRHLERRCPRSRFVSFAKGGAMVNQMRRHFEAGVLSEPPSAFTHLVVFGGVNDLYSDETAGRTPAKIETDLGAIYAAAKARGLRVVALTVAPWGGFTRYYNARRAVATRELNAWILGGVSRDQIDVAVDAFALLACGDPDRLCPRYQRPRDDGLHFGKEGHEALGAALYEAAFFRCS